MNINQLKAQFARRTPGVLGADPLARFAVLLPLVQKKDGLHVLFEVRSFSMRRQPGEICFPGGRIDPDDETPEQAAIRETAEELGVPAGQISMLFPLDYMLSPFGMILHSYAGLLDLSDIQLNRAEVEEVFTIPLDFLLNTDPDIHHVQLKPEPDESFPFHWISGGKEYNWQIRPMEEYFYVYDNRIIWGLTARILKHFLDLMKNNSSSLDK